MSIRLTPAQRRVLEASLSAGRWELVFPLKVKGMALEKTRSALIRHGFASEHHGRLLMTKQALKFMNTTTANMPAYPVMKEPRSGSKTARLVSLLQRPQGASASEISIELDWAAHTIRAAISRGLKKDRGLSVTSAQVKDRGLVYSIAS